MLIALRLRTSRRFAHRGTDQIRWYGVIRTWLFREFPNLHTPSVSALYKFKLTFRLRFSLHFLSPLSPRNRMVC
jgi:hypothetical protein